MNSSEQKFGNDREARNRVWGFGGRDKEIMEVNQNKANIPVVRCSQCVLRARVLGNECTSQAMLDGPTCIDSGVEVGAIQQSLCDMKRCIPCYIQLITLMGSLEHKRITRGDCKYLEEQIKPSSSTIRHCNHPHA